MLAKNILGKHKALSRMEIRCILPVEMFIILETGILCIIFGICNRILSLRILGIWCPSPHFRKVFQKLALLFFRWRVERHIFTSFLLLDWNQYELPTFSSEDENRIFPRKMGSLLNTRHWTNSRNPVTLNVLCRHQNALGQAEFCYWGDKNRMYGKKSRIYSESINQTHIFSWQSDCRLQSMDTLTVEMFLK